MTHNGQREHPIWEHSSADERYHVAVFERDDGIVVLRSSGVFLVEGVLELLEFLSDLSRTRGRRLRVITDNAKVDSIDRGARKAAAAFIEEGSPIERMATFGDNFFMRSFSNLYATISRIPVKSLKTEQQALEWIKGGEVEA